MGLKSCRASGPVSYIHHFKAVRPLVRQLQDLAEAAEIYQTPNSRTITEEVELIRDGAVLETPAGTHAIKVHVDLVEVHIHISGVEKEGAEGA